MLVQFLTTNVKSVLDSPTPPLLEPLFDAAERGLPLEQPAQSIVESLGFESYILAVTTFPILRNDGHFYFSTSVPLAWIVEYDRHSYIEIDPRTIHSWHNLTPLIWDRRIGAGDPKREELFDRAAGYGIGSGVCLGMRGDPHSHAMLGLIVAARDVSDAQARQWAGIKGDITLLAVHFHAIFLRSVVDKGIKPRQHGFPLSAREQQCLRLCAQGQTSADIAQKLTISERTVQFHFSSIMSKLGAANRHEAVALGVTAGIIER
jgi:LuxR family transcriptional regulator, activator of conjugal transfer of Ti plasmids